MPGLVNAFLGFAFAAISRSLTWVGYVGEIAVPTPDKFRKCIKIRNFALHVVILYFETFSL